MKNQYSKIGFLLLFLATSIYSQTPSYQILTYPFSSRAAAMGGGRAVDPSGNIDIQGNPAGASFIDQLQGQVGFVNHLIGIQGYSFAGVLPMEQHRLSIEMIYFDYGLFDGADIFGNLEDTFSYRESATALGYAFKFSEMIRLGSRVGRYHSVADASTQSAFYYDLGAVYHKEADSLTIGLFLASNELGESKETFPSQIHLGATKILSHLPLRINLEGIYGINQLFRFSLGAEVLLHSAFKVRLGLNSNRFDLQTGVSESDFIAGASGGFVIDWQGLIIESATQSFGAVGWVSQLSLSYQL